MLEPGDEPVPVAAGPALAALAAGTCQWPWQWGLTGQPEAATGSAGAGSSPARGPPGRTTGTGSGSLRLTRGPGSPGPALPGSLPAWAQLIPTAPAPGLRACVWSLEAEALTTSACEMKTVA